MRASDAHELIALRLVIGLGAALVMPATLSTITGTFPPEKRIKAVSVWAAVAGGAAVLGVVCSGVLLEYFSWRSVFGLNVVLAIVAVVGALAVVPESANPDAPRLDKGGSALAIVGLVALVYSVIEAPTAGWLSTSTLVGIGAALVVLTGFVAYELRQRDPLLDPRVFTHRRLTAGSLIILAQFFAFFGFIFLILQFLQITRGDSALVAAVSMLPMAVTMMPSARMAPSLAGRFGSRNVCVAGLLLIAVALTVMAQVDATSPYVVLGAGLLVLGAGMGLAMTPATSAITSSLPRDQQGVASAVNDLSRELGGALGIAVIGSITTAVYRSELVLPGVSTRVADHARDSFAVAAHLGGSVATQANVAFVDGVHTALYCAAGTVVAAAGVIFVLLSRSEVPQSHQTETDAADHARQLEDEVPV
jgi:EmrB/QacA subfamily drug resistance transporter